MGQIAGLLLLCVALSGSVLQAQAAPSVIQSILRLEDGWATALVRRDSAYFERTLARGFIYTEDDRTMTRAAVLHDLFSGSDTVSQARNEKMEVHRFGAAIIVTGWLIVEGRGGGGGEGGAFSHRYRFTDIWMRPSGRWQLVAAHDYLAPPR